MSVVKGLSNNCPTISVDAPQLRDPKDNLILAAVVAANTKAIITGDLDLLVLREFNGILKLLKWKKPSYKKLVQAKTQQSHAQTPKHYSAPLRLCVRFIKFLPFHRPPYFNHRAASLA